MRLFFNAVLASLIVLSGCATSSNGDNSIMIDMGDRGTFMTVLDPQGDARLRFGYGSIHPCIQGLIRTKVTWTSENLVLEPTPNMADCPKFRWMIRRNETGADYFQLQGDKWVRTERYPRVRILSGQPIKS